MRCSHRIQNVGYCNLVCPELVEGYSVSPWQTVLASLELHRCARKTLERILSGIKAVGPSVHSLGGQATQIEVMGAQQDASTRTLKSRASHVFSKTVKRDVRR